MDSMWCTHTINLGNKITSKKCIIERIMKRDENNSKKEVEIIIIRKTWEINICDIKIT